MLCLCIYIIFHFFSEFNQAGNAGCLDDQQGIQLALVAEKERRCCTLGHDHMIPAPLIGSFILYQQSVDT
jgi:hypothetical protein